MNPFIPFADVINQGIRAGFIIGNNIGNRRPLTQDVGKALFQPASPIVINNPPRPAEPFFKIGFVEKNIIIVGIFALGAVAIHRSIK